MIAVTSWAAKTFSRRRLDNPASHFKKSALSHQSPQRQKLAELHLTRARSNLITLCLNREN